MDDCLGNRIEKLGLSKAACEELRKCNIDTIQDLMLLINEKLISQKKNKTQQSYSIGMKDAVLSVLKDRPNEILSCNEIREDLILKYGDSVSSNIGSIRSMALTLAYNGAIERASSGQYFYPLNSTIAYDVAKGDRAHDIRHEYISLKDAIPDVLKEIDGPFDYRIIREKLHDRYRGIVTTKKSSIKTGLNKLFREGVIKRTETGDYIYCQSASNAGKKNITLDDFLQGHLGKEIEFRYKSERSCSDRRWRRETVWMYDDVYLYVAKRYVSGRHIIFRKERIVEYREVNNKTKEG